MHVRFSRCCLAVVNLSLTGTMPLVVQVDGMVLWQNAARQSTVGSESPQTCRQPQEYRAKTRTSDVDFAFSAGELPSQCGGGGGDCPATWSNSDSTQAPCGVHWQPESGALPMEATARRRVPVAPSPEGPRGAWGGDWVSWLLGEVTARGRAHCATYGPCGGLRAKAGLLSPRRVAREVHPQPSRHAPSSSVLTPQCALAYLLISR